MSTSPEDPKDTRRGSIYRQSLLYVFVGVTSAIIELVIFQVLCTSNAVSVGFANVCAMVVSTAYNFTLNGRVTFQAQGNKVLCLIKYLALFLFNICFTTICISLLTSAGVNPVVAKVCMMACVVVWNFILYRRFVFI